VGNPNQKLVSLVKVCFTIRQCIEVYLLIPARALNFVLFKQDVNRGDI